MKTYFIKNTTISLVIIFVLSISTLAITQSGPAKSKSATSKPIPPKGIIGVTGYTGSTGHTGPNNYDDRKPEKDKTKYNEQSSNNNRQHTPAPQR